ncbi:MAG: hypothetical protein ACPGNT_04920, partial [Rhodospirillales bacterium]
MTSAEPSQEAYHDPLAKRFLRGCFRTTLGLHARLTAVLPAPSGPPALYYGGARPGQAGGPRVKVARLSAVWPERLTGYNVTYLLSNTGYLSDGALAALKKRGPLVLNQNGVFYPAWFKGDWQAHNRRMALAHGRADHVLYQSDFCRRAALRFLGPASGSSE